MPDDLSKIRPQDSSRINIHEPYEVRYWTNKFNISEDKLTRAVNTVGTSVASVTAWLRLN
jgi:hypothetical protein